ncbi:MAG: hypothetical protein IJT73_05740 [Selenomonadaceae bacterium]|nr:hypothetical protein [Selenomonadaceae bacterium]
MIPVLLALVGGYLVVKNWDEVTKWLQEFMTELQVSLKKMGIEGYTAKLFSNIQDGALKLIHRLYYKENGKWIEKTTTREIDESQVPEWAKAGLGEKETDVTNRYEQQLQLKI